MHIRVSNMIIFSYVLTIFRLKNQSLVHIYQIFLCYYFHEILFLNLNVINICEISTR